MPVRAPGKKKPARAGQRQRPPLPVLSVRLNRLISLEMGTDGNLVASLDGYPTTLGKFSPEALRRVLRLRTGLPFKSLAAKGNAVAQEVDRLVRRLARRGLVEYCLVRGDRDLVVIEPQTPDYWPQTPKLAATARIVLSRFAYLRRRRTEMVLESPRAGALFRISDPGIAATLATLSAPQRLGTLRRLDGFPGNELFALLIDCNMLFRIGAPTDDGLRPTEGDANLVLWDFHDLLFHAQSTEGRNANPIGGLYPYADAMPPPPAVRPPWPGTKIDLRELATPSAETISPLANLLRARHSTRSFDDIRPITLAELAQLLDAAARIQGKWDEQADLDPDGGPTVAYTARPYPSAGSAYELEFYLAVTKCEGLKRGFYHYDADAHALTPIGVREQDFEALMERAVSAIDAPHPPQIVMAMAARFDRISWKYSAISYSLILKNVGVMIQTLYLAATEMGLGGCAIGINNIDLFAKMTGIDFHVESLVGQFALGRGLETGTQG